MYYCCYISDGNKHERQNNISDGINTKDKAKITKLLMLKRNTNWL